MVGKRSQTCQRTSGRRPNGLEYKYDGIFYPFGFGLSIPRIADEDEDKLSIEEVVDEYFMHHIGDHRPSPRGRDEYIED